jgi:hypothetical protein
MTHRLKELKATRDFTPNKSLRQTGMSMNRPKKDQPIAPEDNWELVGNPSVYLDELPQPFRFVNKCLNDMILKPVSDAITKIEERKKTTEYEGFIKEAQATGTLDLEGIICIEKVGVMVGPGGVIDKQE